MLVQLSRVPQPAPTRAWAACTSDGRATFPECWGRFAKFSARFLAPGDAPRPSPFARLYARVGRRGWRRVGGVE